MLFLALFMMVAGLEELQKKDKRFLGYMSIIASFFVIFVSIQGFILK
ncbi:DUF3953 domain-containing protein [Paenibacillus sp. 2TAB19]